MSSSKVAEVLRHFSQDDRFHWIPRGHDVKDAAPITADDIELQRLAAITKAFISRLTTPQASWRRWNMGSAPVTANWQHDFADFLLLIKQQMACITAATEHPLYKTAASIVSSLESAIDVLKRLAEAKTAADFAGTLAGITPLIKTIKKNETIGDELSNLLREHAFSAWRCSLLLVKGDALVRAYWSYVTKAVVPTDAVLHQHNLNLKRRENQDHSDLAARIPSILKGYACFTKATSKSLTTIVDDLELLEFLAGKLNQVDSPFGRLPMSMIEWALAQVRAVQRSKTLDELGSLLHDNPLSRDAAAIVGNDNRQVRHLIKAVMTAYTIRFTEITSFDVYQRPV